MTAHDVVVVGAGLAGLACARELSRWFDDVVVLDAADAVGGRVRSDLVDGFTLDRGFQVLNTGYPELRRTVDLGALDLRPFDPAAALLVDGDRFLLGNPLQRPSSIGAALRLPLGDVVGKAALASYAVRCAGLPPARLKRRDDVSSDQAWREAGIPDELAAVLRAFFGGVLLEREMTTSRRFTDLMVRMFARGDSTVPARGMQALPEQLAGSLRAETVRLGVRVESVTPHEVRTAGGTLRARAVVVATDAWEAARLLPTMSPVPPAHGVTTIYHVTEHLPGASAMLLLEPGRSPVANSIVMSEVAPEYAPPGRALIATSLVQVDGRSPVEPDGPEVRAALTRLHHADVSGWRPIATYDIPRALPGMPAPHPLRRPVRVPTPGGTVYVAGDHRDTSSIQGALVSGRRGAFAVRADLGVSPLR